MEVLCAPAAFNPEFHLCFLTDVNSRSARVLFLLVVPGHLVFLYTISSMQGGHTTLTLIFIVFYMTAALLQVSRSPSGSVTAQAGRGRGRAIPVGSCSARLECMLLCSQQHIHLQVTGPCTAESFAKNTVCQMSWYQAK